MLTSYSEAILDTLGPDGSMYAIYLFIRTIGFCMLTVYFIITLGTRAESRDFSPSVMFKTFLEFFIGYVLALYSFDIVKNLFIFGDYLASCVTESLSSNFGAVGDFSTTLASSIETFSFESKVIYTLKGMLPYIMCVVTNIIITYTVMTRVLRVCVNAVLSPLAVSNFFDGTRRSDAMKFLKRTFAMCLQCSVIMIIVACTSSLTSYMETNKQYGSADASTVVTAKNEMLDSIDLNRDALSLDTLMKPGGHGDEGSFLYTSYKKVKKDKESTYQEYEKNVNTSIFKRDDDNHYIYDGEGYAVLKDKYMMFSQSNTENFLNTLLGGDNYWIFLLLLVVKVGLIKKSMSLCNVIVGV